MDGIPLLLNGAAHRAPAAAAATTLLDYLRGPAALRGTKEGCAEGDCGACSVVLGEVGGDGLRYRAANACLMLVGQAAGKLVLTVEGVAEADGTLHPVQQALIGAHGSQCGFCTPGFVMAMVALHHGGEGADDGTIHEALAGNLCRCTGYRPIVDAMKTAAAVPATRFAERDGAIRKALDALDRWTGSDAVRAPTSLAELLRLRAAMPEAVLYAGGTDLGLLASRHRAPPAQILLLGGVPELMGVSEENGALVIGAATPYGDALPAIAQRYPSFGTLLRRLGSRQIRALGTFGGNLGTASPIGDTLPCLVALDAELDLASVGGTRRIEAEAFFLGYRRTALRPDEVITAIRIPEPCAGEIFRVYKVSKRYDQDIATVCGAFRLTLADGRVSQVRIAYGGMAATPKRAAATEAALAGQPWTAATIDALAAPALAADFAPLSDWRGTGAYRARVALNLLHRLRLETEGVATEVFVL